MKVHYSNVEKPRHPKEAVKCVNCDRYANNEDIKFGCENCAWIKSSGEVPRGYVINFPEGGFYV
jgi:Zn finger protein HypA/HybF involved in hydrogenase expression